MSGIHTTMPEQRRWFGREPALIIQGVAAILAVLIAWKLKGLNDGVAASITAFLTALAATITAVYVRPWAPSIFGGLIAAGATLLASFGLHLTQTQTAAVTFLVAMLVAILPRPQQTPITGSDDSNPGHENGPGQLGRGHSRRGVTSPRQPSH